MKDKELSGFYSKKNILVLGGAGFIGSNLSRTLVDYNARVTAIDSFDPFCGANIFNIRDIKKSIILIKKKIEDILPDIKLKKYSLIFNCIGHTNHHISHLNVQRDYEINMLSGIRILEKLAKEKAPCSMVSIGSRSQYGKSGTRLIGESHPMNPLDFHSVHKTALEYYHSVFANNYKLGLLYARLTNVYGPGQRLRGEGIGMIGEMIRNTITGEKVIIYGSLTRVKDILFVEDAVSALLALGAIANKRFAVYNVGGYPCTLNKLIEAIRGYIRVKTEIMPFPEHIKKIDTQDAVLDIKKLAKKTGWSPETGIESGMHKTLEFYEKNRKRYL